MSVRFTRANSNGASETTGVPDYNAAYTMLTWVRFESLPTNQVVLAAYNSGLANFDVVWLAAGPEWEIRVQDTATGAHSDGGGSIASGTWYFGAMVRASDVDIRLFVGTTIAGIAQVGAPVTYDVDPARSTACNGVGIGRMAGSAHLADAEFRGAKLFIGVALTPTQLQQEAARSDIVNTGLGTARKAWSLLDTGTGYVNRVAPGTDDLTALGSPIPTTDATHDPPELDRATFPVADVSVGGWTTDTGGTTGLYSRIDEGEPAVDTDYIQSTASPDADRVKLAIGMAAALNRSLQWTLAVRHTKTP